MNVVLFFIVLLFSQLAFAKPLTKPTEDQLDKAAVLVRHCSKSQVYKYGGPGILSLEYRMWEKKRNVRGFIMEIDLRQTNFEKVIRKLAKRSCI